MKIFKLTKINDQRCIEFYQKAFENLKSEQQEELRIKWVNKNNSKK